MNTGGGIATTALVLILVAGCATAPPPPDSGSEPAVEALVEQASATSVLGPDATFVGSPYPDVGLSGLFPLRGPDQCRIAVPQGGEDSFAVRLDALRNARKSIRIQALVFKGDESGLRIAEILKQGHAAADSSSSRSCGLRAGPTLLAAS